MTQLDNSTDGSVVQYDLPSDIGAEECVLGSILLDPSVYQQVREIVEPSDFFREKNRWMAYAFDKVAVNGILNPYEARPLLRAKGMELEYFRYLLDQTPTAVLVDYYAKLVRTLSLKRRLFFLLDDFQRSVSDGLPLEELIPGLTVKLDELRNQSLGGEEQLPLTWAKDLETDIDSIKSLWADVIFPGSLHLISGVAGVGKTTFLYGFAAKACKGEDFLGFHFPRPFRVLHIDMETPFPLQASKTRLVAEGVPPDGWAFMREVDIESNLIGLSKVIVEERFDIVIVDTISQAFRTEKEEDNAEAKRQMKALRRLCDTGCAVIAVHHIGKSTQRHNVHKARGASARADSADVVVNMEAMAEDMIRLEVAKSRWLGISWKLLLRKVGEDAFEPAEMKGEESIQEVYRAQNFILRRLENTQEAMQRKEIFTDPGVLSERTLDRGLSALVQLGRVCKPRHGYYSLPETQQKNNIAISPPLGCGEMATSLLPDYYLPDGTPVTIEQLLERWIKSGSPPIFLPNGKTCKDLRGFVSKSDLDLSELVHVVQSLSCDPG